MKTKISLMAFVLVLSLFVVTPAFAKDVKINTTQNISVCRMYKNRLKLYKSLLQDALHTSDNEKSSNKTLVKVYRENIKITEKDIEENCK